MRKAGAAVVATLTAAAIFGVITLLALESGGVAVLHTTQPSGEQRRTRVWFAEHDGALWVEAATPSRPFYVDLSARPGLELEIRRTLFDWPRMLRGRAELVAEPGGHARIRSLLAAKYGWADGWIALLQDTSASRAVKILPDGSASNSVDGGRY